MSNYNNIFHFHSIEKLREIIQEESDKKYDDKRNKYKQNGNNNNNCYKKIENKDLKDENSINN